MLPFGGRSPRSNAQNEVSLHARACILPVARPRSGCPAALFQQAACRPPGHIPVQRCCGATGTTGQKPWHGTRAPANQNLGASGAQSSRPAIVGPTKINYNDECQKAPCWLVPAVDVHVPGREKTSQVDQPGLYLTSGVVGYLAGFFMNRNHAARPTAENGKEVDDWPLETGSHSNTAVGTN